MSSIELRTDYWSDMEARAAFKSFMVAIHGLDLATWEEAGFWDPDYRPFTFFDQERVVSNVCVYSMRMVIEDRVARVAQISGVGTLSDYRRQGLARELTELGMKWARETGHEFFFLFANDSAVPLYRDMGFVPTEEYEAVMRVTGRTLQAGARRLQCDEKNDLELIRERAATRCAVSRRLGVLNERLLMFHVLHGLGVSAHYIESLKLIVFTERKNGILTLFDIVGETMVPFCEIYPFIADPSDKEVVFKFTPDALNISSTVEFRRAGGDNLHLSRGTELMHPVIFPYTAHA